MGEWGRSTELELVRNRWRRLAWHQTRLKALTIMIRSRKLLPVMMVTVRPIPVDLWQQFKAQAARERLPLYKLLIKVVGDYLQSVKGQK